MQQKIQIGISACLIGQEVRYNGGHCQSSLCLKTLSEHFHYSAFCPEVAAGFSVPRPSMRLTGNPDKPRLSYRDDHNADVSAQLITASREAMPKMQAIHGYILMKNSPSCGLERIKVYQDNGHPHSKTREGLFTEQLRKTYPNLPIEEEGRLHDKYLFENFVLRVFCYHQWRSQVMKKVSVGEMMKFHSRHKFIMQAHDYNKTVALGRFLAGLEREALIDGAEEYERRFMDILAKPASRAGYCNTMMHILGFLKQHVDSKSRQNLVSVIKSYRRGELPLIAPMTLLKHYTPRFGGDYINDQSYFDPYPEALGLRNGL
ncbi:YbgA family protein [Pseudoteredinibacter isoporae]|uniref:YbgA family protein n=1 Tax=Pseudoteredinibacter isoporae TaxID=570281 RepID=UPI00310C5403